MRGRWVINLESHFTVQQEMCSVALQTRFSFNIVVGPDFVVESSAMGEVEQLANQVFPLNLNLGHFFYNFLLN